MKSGNIWRYYRALYGACSEHILLQRNPGYLSESGYHRMCMDGRIRFQYATCRRGTFESGKKKLRIQKYPCRYVWIGPGSSEGILKQLLKFQKREYELTVFFFFSDR